MKLFGTLLLCMPILIFTSCRDTARETTEEDDVQEVAVDFPFKAHDFILDMQPLWNAEILLNQGDTTAALELLNYRVKDSTDGTRQIGYYPYCNSDTPDIDCVRKLIANIHKVKSDYRKILDSMDANRYQYDDDGLCGSMTIAKRYFENIAYSKACIALNDSVRLLKRLLSATGTNEYDGITNEHYITLHLNMYYMICIPLMRLDRKCKMQ